MPDSLQKDLEFTEPATYRIVVEGRLDDRLAASVGGLRVTMQAPEGGLPTATLVGLFQDQAALSGLLHAIQGSRNALLSIDRVADDPSGEPIEPRKTSEGVDR